MKNIKIIYKIKRRNDKMYDEFRDFGNSWVETNEIILKTFIRMFVGLLITGIVAFSVYASGLYTSILIGGSYYILAMMEIAVVLLFSLMFRKLSPIMVSILFYLYAFINGITMSCIFIAFDITAIFGAFFTTAVLFGALAIYGYLTKSDMTKWGNIINVGLIVGIIVSIINIFMGSSTLDLIINWAMLILFCGITIYDMNRIKYMQNYVQCEQEKIYIYCAMQLYLDFINIFIRILSLLGRGNRKN
jgi:hypothetical protein